VFTSMCVTALLLGRRSGTVLDRFLAALVAAGCMLPCRMLLPRLYASANAPPGPGDVPWGPASSKHSAARGSGSQQPSGRASKARARGPGRTSRQAVAPLGGTIVLRDETKAAPSGQTAQVDVSSAAMAAFADRRLRIQNAIMVGGGDNGSHLLHVGIAIMRPRRRSPARAIYMHGCAWTFFRRTCLTMTYRGLG
jgi:hypothetical protein